MCDRPHECTLLVEEVVDSRGGLVSNLHPSLPLAVAGELFVAEIALWSAIHQYLWTGQRVTGWVMLS